MAPMIALLEKQGYTLEHDVEDYPNHNDVARFFPALCKKKLEMIIAGEKK